MTMYIPNCGGVILVGVGVLKFCRSLATFSTVGCKCNCTRAIFQFTDHDLVLFKSDNNAIAE